MRETRSLSQLSGLHRTDAAFEGASRAKLVIQCDGAAWDVRVRKRVVAAGRGGSRHGSGSGLSLLSTGRSFVASFLSCTQDQYGIDKSWVLLQPRAEPPVDLTDE